MEEVFTGRITFAISDIYGNKYKNEDDRILGVTKETYINKCYNGKIIKDIIKINSHGIIEYGRNHFPAKTACDVEFVALCMIYNVGDIMLVRITMIEQNKIIADCDNYIAYAEINKNIASSLDLKIGNHLVVVIREVCTTTNKKISMSFQIFKFPPKIQLTLVANELENNTISEAIKLCVENINKIKENKSLDKIYKIFHRKGNAPKWPRTESSIFDPIKIIDQIESTYFVIDPFDHLEDGKYYTVTNVNNINDPNIVIKKEAISLEFKLYKYCLSVNNFYDVIQQIGNLSDEDFNNNEHIWNYYSK